MGERGSSGSSLAYARQQAHLRCGFLRQAQDRLFDSALRTPLRMTSLREDGSLPENTKARHFWRAFSLCFYFSNSGGNSTPILGRFLGLEMCGLGDFFLQRGLTRFPASLDFACAPSPQRTKSCAGDPEWPTQ